MGKLNYNGFNVGCYYSTFSYVTFLIRRKCLNQIALSKSCNQLHATIQSSYKEKETFINKKKMFGI